MKTKILVLKIGGNIIDDEKLLQEVLSNFSKVEGPKILIHGGGKIATSIGNQLKIGSKFHEGRRITTKENLDVMKMVYAGLINTNIVAQLQGLGTNSLGLSGVDCNLISSKKRDSNPIDFGFVGDIEQINKAQLQLILSNGWVPVFCAITHDGNGNLFNTNADSIAAEIAVSLAENYEVELKYCFEHQGVLLDQNNPDSLVKSITKANYEQLKINKKVVNGMLPKLDNCLYALENNVAHISIGNINHILGKNGNCTQIIH
jgi:acetylglutamate kinase